MKKKNIFLLKPLGIPNGEGLIALPISFVFEMGSGLILCSVRSRFPPAEKQ
jgi:hypothetical protein